MPVYTYQNLLDDSQRDAGAVTNILKLANRATRFVVSDIDLRSTKRKSYLSPSLNKNEFDYQSPADLKELGVIDIRRVQGRQEKDRFNMVTSEYFDRNKTFNKNLVCIEDRDFLKKLRLSADLHGDDNEVTVNECDSLTANGTWTAGGSGSGLFADSDVFINGTASLNLNGGASYTSILLTNSTMTAVDLSTYTNGGSVFLWVWIPATAGLTSFQLRIGSDASNYYQRTVTVTNENLAFYTGWNLLRFDFNAATQTGTVVQTAINYIQLNIIGDGTAAATTGWRLDNIVARRGISHEVWYYTKFAWQNSTGTYIENSTAATDLLNADTEEYELFILKLKEMLALDLKNFDDVKAYKELYAEVKDRYLTNYPSERLLMIQTNYKYASEPQESWLN